MLKQFYTALPKSKKNGQSTVEYILLIAGILAFFIIFLRPKGTFQNTLNATYSGGTNSMMDVSNRLWSF